MQKITSQSEWISRARKVLPAGGFGNFDPEIVIARGEGSRVWDEDGNLYILLADEICPDTCRLWDTKTGEKMDKDRFRFDLGDLVEGYQYVAEKLGLIPEGGIIKGGNINEKLAENLDQIENELANARRMRDLKAPKPRKS